MGGPGASVLQRASGSIGRGLRGSGAWGQSWPGPESGSCVGQSCARRVPRGHPGEARGQQKEAGAQSGLARNPGGLQARTQGRLVPALMWGCRPLYLDQSHVSLIQNWGQGVPGNKTQAVSADRKPQNKAVPPPSPPSRVFKALWAFSDSRLCRREKQAAIGQACGRARSQVVGSPSPPDVCSLGVSGWGQGRLRRESGSYPCPRSTYTPAMRGCPSGGRWWTSASRCTPTTRPSSRRWPPCSGPTTNLGTQPGQLCRGRQSCSIHGPPGSAAPLAQLLNWEASGCPGRRAEQEAGGLQPRGRASGLRWPRGLHQPTLLLPSLLAASGHPPGHIL